MKNNREIIEDFSYVTPNLKSNPSALLKDISVSDKARVNKLDGGYYGVQPNVFNSLVSDLIMTDWKSDSGLPLAE